MRTPYLDSKGNEIPSVTQILAECKNAEPLIGWAYKLSIIGKNVFKEKQKNFKIGNEVHQAIEEKLSGVRRIPHFEEPESRVAFSSFQHYFSQVKPKPVATELKMVCECPFHPPFGGTIDFVGEIGEAFCVIDWKTAEKIFEDYLLQVLGYAHLFEFGIPCGSSPIGNDAIKALKSKSIDSLHLVCLSKKFVSYTDYCFKQEEEMQQNFFKCVELFYSKKKVSELL